MSLIGISGKIGSGKDTVGLIIQYLELKNIYPNVWKDKYFDFFLDYGEDKSHTWNSKFQIKKFADKLKDIVCMLIGCTREQLEDRDFKEKELGEEWWYYSYGYDENKKAHSYIKIPYLKANNETRKDYKDYLLKLTPRLLLQLLGTDCGRNIIHPNIWVNALMNEYKETEDYVGGSGHTTYPTYSSPDWIITDMRFSNEKEVIESKGGFTIRVNRPAYLQDNKAGILQPVHESETALDNAQFDYVIDNTGTIEELIEKVKSILIKENLL